MKNINLSNLTVQNCTFDGVLISGASGINIARSDFTENGSSIVPGAKLQHNLLLSHCTGITIKNSRLDTSPYGSGIALDHCMGVMVTNCEIARNAYYGLLVTESRDITVKGNLIEANDRSGVMMEFLEAGSKNITVSNNLVHYNGGYGVESYASKNCTLLNNKFVGNGNTNIQQKLSTKKIIVME